MKERFASLKGKVADSREELDFEKAENRAVWRKEDASIAFKNGSMQYFEENEKAESIENVLYFYYDVEIQVPWLGKPFKLELRARDFPKADVLGKAIDLIAAFDVKQEGYLLENYIDEDEMAGGTFYRKVHYHQIEIGTEDEDYFIRLEKYAYEMKQFCEQEPKEWTNYKMTIGEVRSMSDSEAGPAIFFNSLSEEDLLRLKETANRFVAETIETENGLIDDREKEKKK